MIQRLLQQQTEEKDQAYSRWRNAKCKKMVIDNKRGVAFKQQMAKEVKNKEIDNEMRKIAEEAEITRQKEKEGK